MKLFWKPEIIKIKPRNSKVMYFTGLIAMLMNKLRRTIKTYSSPRPFSMDDIMRNVKYDLSVVANWEKIARNYIGNPQPFLDKSILEIGPGPDLGTGLILLSQGAKNYHAIDTFPLALRTPTKFYETLLDSIHDYPFISKAQKAYLDFQGNKRCTNLAYDIVKYPSMGCLEHKQFDIIISQAVWEHFSNIETTLDNLVRVAKPEGIFINNVDLSTHTRFIKDIDPLNILRYEEWIYNHLSFPGSPNRLRASDYSSLSQKKGLENIQLIITHELNYEYVNAVRPKLASTFRQKEKDDLAILSFWWLAQFPSGI